MTELTATPTSTPAPPPTASPVEPMKSDAQWQLIGGLLGLLLAISYQWRLTGDWNWVSQLTLIQYTWQLFLPIGWFFLGWWLGGVILWVDEQYSQAWYQSGPITRSVGFLAVLVVVSGWVVTTAGSSLGTGLVLSLLTAIWLEILIWQRQPEAFRQRFLHDVRPQAVTKLEQQWRGKWGLVVGLIWLVIVGLMLI